MTDGLGSTVVLANASGAVTDTWTYDVFGAVRSHTGSSGTEFTFAGEQNDPNGLEYLRGRYYDNATGRFLSRDPAQADVMAPGELNRYPYVENSPVNYVDPTGQKCARFMARVGVCNNRTIQGRIGTVVVSAYDWCERAQCAEIATMVGDAFVSCGIWGLGTTAMTGNPYLGVLGCVVGATGNVISNLVEDPTVRAIMQCVDWAMLGAAVGAGGGLASAIGTGGVGCVQGALSSIAADLTHEELEVLLQCLIWGFRTSNFLGCIPGGVDALIP
jgi:RHS repeat-associated protein